MHDDARTKRPGEPPSRARANAPTPHGVLFGSEPKAILDAIRDELRDHHNYVPIMFDFTNTASRNYNETITTLARMARFVIADLTDAKELRSELISIVSQLPSVAVQPILKRGAKLYATFEADIRRNRKSVLKVYRYADRDSLLANLRERIIEPAEAKTKRLRRG